MTKRRRARQPVAEIKAQPAGEHDRGGQSAPCCRAVPQPLGGAACAKGDDPRLGAAVADQRRGARDDPRFGGGLDCSGKRAGSRHVRRQFGVARDSRGNACGILFIEPVVGKGGEVEQPLRFIGRRLGIPTAAPHFPIRRFRRARAASPLSSHTGDLLFSRFYAEGSAAIPTTYWFLFSLDIILEM